MKRYWRDIGVVSMKDEDNWITLSDDENDDISWTAEHSIKSIKEHFIIKD